MESVVRTKAYDFALEMISLYKSLISDKHEFVLSKQVLRSGTAVGALVTEAEYAQSKADFINKMNIALKEANETKYWLLLLRDSSYLEEEKFMLLYKNCEEIVRILASIVKTSKNNQNKK